MASSISYGLMVSPPRFMISLERPVMKRYPSPFKYPQSPTTSTRTHKSQNVHANAEGDRQSSCNSPVLNHPASPPTVKKHSSCPQPTPAAGTSYPAKHGPPLTRILPTWPGNNSLTSSPAPTASKSSVTIQILGPAAVPEVPIGSRSYEKGGVEMGMHSVMP